MSNPYTETFSNFWLACLDAEWHEKTCDYWYMIRCGGQAHTAFHTVEALLQWLDERGLKPSEAIPAERGAYKVMHVEGTYRRVMHMDVEVFTAIVPIRTVAELENGEYTLGKITEQIGIRTVHCSIQMSGNVLCSRGSRDESEH